MHPHFSAVSMDRRSRGPLSNVAAKITAAVLLAAISLPLTVCAGAQAQELVRESAPRKWLEAHLPEHLPAMTLPDYVKNDSLLKAQAECFAGRYKLSLLTVQKVKGAKGWAASEVALVQGTALRNLGRRDEALAVLENAAVAADPKVQVLRACVLGDLGRQDQGIAILADTLKQHADSVAAHYWMGRLCEDLGKMDAARDAYRWFEQFIDIWEGSSGEAPPFAKAEDVTLIARGLDRWATIDSQYQNRAPLHKLIFTMFVKAYDHIDAGYWPAHEGAAEYRLSHDEQEDAMKELALASRGNPRDLDSLMLYAQISLASYNFDGVDHSIAAIRSIEYDSLAADLLDARNFLQQRRPKDAEQFVQRVLAKQPKNLEALGLLAATYALQLKDQQTADVLKQVDAIDPKNASAYLEVAEQLGAMRQYPRAAAMYKIAIARAPWWTAARNGLGLLYTQSGDEDEASTGDKENNAFTVLSAAQTLDPYNHRTTNYLRLLDDLRKFTRKETAHFIVMYDADKDPIVPEYFSDYLESIYGEVCGEYHCEPPVKTFIEVFPSHDAFSVRTTGSPWIGTVGASTGRVIALDPPRSGVGTMGTFNWAQVLRHEFTHTVTLAATDNRIAHWMTEGLAVMEEHIPLRWEWIPMLNDAVKKKQLFTMENLTWAFVRPKRPIDRQLAYAESFWICSYIDQRWGHDAILKMLEEFRQGKSQDDVFPLILGESITSFQNDFFAWTEKQVATWGYDPDSTKKYDALVTKGEQQLKARRFADAVKTWQEMVALRPVDSLPHKGLAALYLRPEVGDLNKAIEQLSALDKVELKDNRYAMRIARAYRDENDLTRAVDYAMKAVYTDPYDMKAHQLLSELYEMSKNTAGLEREQRVIPVLSAWLEKRDKDRDVPHGN